MGNIVYIGFAILLAAFTLALIRIVKGPEIQDRIVALDLTSSIVMAFILLYSISVNKAIYIDIVMIISLISFIGTVAISAYIKNKNT